MHIALVEPEIPQNTGNIARTCAATSTTLHLVRPLGFSTDDRYLKRAGLDYWSAVEIIYHESFEEFFEATGHLRRWYATTKANQSYADVRYTMDDMLVFGRESAGLPQPLLVANPDHTIRIPMKPETRSLNLSNSAAVILFEALRQNDFPNLR